MGDNHQVYRRINQGLRQLYPKQMTGRQARHMNTLAGMVSGIVRSGKCQMKAMGKKAPDKSKVESRSKRFTRYVQNEQVDVQSYYLPFIIPLLVGLARCGPLVLVMDGSEVGRGCLALVMSVVYKKRALPLVWLVVKGSCQYAPVNVPPICTNTVPLPCTNTVPPVCGHTVPPATASRPVVSKIKEYRLNSLNLLVR